MTRDGALWNVTAKEIREALPSAGHNPADLGASGPIQAVTDPLATVLIDIVADLYYQPRFSAKPPASLRSGLIREQRSDCGLPAPSRLGRTAWNGVQLPLLKQGVSLKGG